MSSFALFLALLIGLSLGALGSGGSIVTLPILVYVAGVPPKAAVGISLAVVGGTSLLGSYLHWRRGNLFLKPALLFASTGIPGAYLGAIGTHFVPASTLMLLFAGLMFVVGIQMLRPFHLQPASAKCSIRRCMITGFALGVLTGFLGVGGGFLIVPALIWFAGLDAKHAISTSLGVIAVNSIAGVAGQLQHTNLDWILTAEFLSCAAAGMLLGLPIASRMPDRVLRRVFAAVVLIIAVVMFWRSIADTRQAGIRSEPAAGDAI